MKKLLIIKNRQEWENVTKLQIVNKDCLKYETKKRLYNSHINGLYKLIEIKDKKLAKHSYRVYQLSKNIGYHLDLSTKKIVNLKLGSLFHDLGRILIPQNTSVEKHPQIGARAFNNFFKDKEIYKVIKHHHERIDGTGYPSGLKGDKIPLEARIIAVANTFDNLVFSKSFKKEGAILSIVNNSGIMFDKNIAFALRDVYFNNNYSLTNSGNV